MLTHTYDEYHFVLLADDYFNLTVMYTLPRYNYAVVEALLSERTSGKAITEAAPKKTAK